MSHFIHTRDHRETAVLIVDAHSIKEAQHEMLGRPPLKGEHPIWGRLVHFAERLHGGKRIECYFVSPVYSEGYSGFLDSLERYDWTVIRLEAGNLAAQREQKVRELLRHLETYPDPLVLATCDTFGGRLTEHLYRLRWINGSPPRRVTVVHLERQSDFLETRDFGALGLLREQGHANGNVAPSRLSTPQRGNGWHRDRETANPLRSLGSLSNRAVNKLRGAREHQAPKTSQGVTGSATVSLRDLAELLKRSDERS